MSPSAPAATPGGRLGIRLTVLGGAREVGANSTFLQLEDTGLLLDAGMHPKKQGTDALPSFGAVDGDVDAILVSHAHLDHIGSLPVALKCFPRAKVYTTGPTSLLGIRMLRNAVSVSRSRARTPEGPLFTDEEVDWVEHVLRIQEPGRSFVLDDLAGPRPRITFFEAGHILGAAGILVEHAGRRIFYTGDTCATAQFVCGPARYPSGPIDLLLLESTHAADANPDLETDQRVFANASREIARFIGEVAERGGSVLIPVFAMGRAQEILAVLDSLAQRGRIPRLPLYTSGLAHAVCRIYDATRKDSDRLHPDLRFEEIGYKVLEPDRIFDPALLAAPSILAVTSGMMHAGTSSHSLAKRILADPKNGVAIVGYLDPESPGYALAEAPAGGIVDLGGAVGPVRVSCPVVRFGFTAHSRASQLLATATALAPRKVVLVHGDTPAVETQKKRLEAEGIDVFVAEERQSLDL